MKQSIYIFAYGLLLILFFQPWSAAQEITHPAVDIKDDSHSQVIIRKQPKTGRSYVSIVSSDVPVPEDPFTHQANHYSRPDYRMLDPKAKKGDYVYEGPYSDRTKVYLFGATLIATGITGGAIGMVLAPAATGAGAAAAGGGGAYLGGAAAATAAGGAAYHELTKERPEDKNFERIAETKTKSKV